MNYRMIMNPDGRYIKSYDCVISWKDDPETLVDVLVAVDDDLYVEFYEHRDDEEWQDFDRCFWRYLTRDEWREVLDDPTQPDEEWSLVRVI